jgi:hypothetical protein
MLNINILLILLITLAVVVHSSYITKLKCSLVKGVANFQLYMYLSILILTAKLHSSVSIITVIVFITIILFNCVPNRNFTFILVLNLFLLMSLENSTLFELILLIESVNVIIIFLIILNRQNYFSLKKPIYMTLIGLNVVTIVLFLLLYCYVCVKLKTSNFNIIKLSLTDSFAPLLNIYIYLTIIIKLGLILGPKFNNIFYIYLTKSYLFIYLYTYYLILPFMVVTLVGLLQFNYILFYILVSGVLLSNIFYFKLIKSYKNLLFISGQINLLYMQILIFG